MVTRIRNINPIQLGIVYAVLCAVVGLIFGIFAALFGGVMASVSPSGSAGFGLLSIILFPIFAAVAGFIEGALGGLIYNLVAGWTGGIEMTLTSAPIPTGAATVVP